MTCLIRTCSSIYLTATKSAIMLIEIPGIITPCISVLFNFRTVYGSDGLNVILTSDPKEILSVIPEDVLDDVYTEDNPIQKKAYFYIDGTYQELRTKVKILDESVIRCNPELYNRYLDIYERFYWLNPKQEPVILLRKTIVPDISDTKMFYFFENRMN